MNRIWVVQRSGKQFWINPDAMPGHRVGPIDTTVGELAFALSGIRRFSGHSPMTVAEHSVMVSRAAGREAGRLGGLLGLFHDADEAFGFGDINGPVKRAAAPALRSLAAEVRDRVWESIPDLLVALQNAVEAEVDPAWEVVERLDAQFGRWERDWTFPEPVTGPIPPDFRRTPLPDGVHAVYYGSAGAEAAFLSRYAELTCPAPSSSTSKPVRPVT